MTKEPTHIFFVASKHDAQEALQDYSVDDDKVNTLIFPTHIPALIHMFSHMPKAVSRIDELIHPAKSSATLRKIPLRLAQQLINGDRILNLWIDVFRQELKKNLSQYYVLKKIHHKTGFDKIISSPISFSPKVYGFGWDVFPLRHGGNDK